MPNEGRVLCQISDAALELAGMKGTESSARMAQFLYSGNRTGGGKYWRPMTAMALLIPLLGDTPWRERSPAPISDQSAGGIPSGRHWQQPADICLIRKGRVDQRVFLIDWRAARKAN